jgi:GLPGLI family protein
MKRYFLSAIILVSIAAAAQTKQGTITYERRVDVYRRIKDEQVKAMVPQFQTAKSELVFNDNVAVYKALVEEDNAPDPFDNNSGGNRIIIKVGGPSDNAVLYKNYANQKFLEQTELDEKNYIIDDTIKKAAWKIYDETKTILNHVCKKATMKTERGSDVTAWYAEDIPAPVGPDSFDGLPGAILMVDVNNGEIVYNTLEIKDDVDSKVLAEPSKGKHITRADFNKKMDELFGAPAPDGRRIITRDN